MQVGLIESVDYFLHNDADLRLLADSIAGADARADQEVAWTEIVRWALEDIEACHEGG